jgi:hypothetical protein
MGVHRRYQAELSQDWAKKGRRAQLLHLPYPY